MDEDVREIRRAIGKESYITIGAAVSLIAAMFGLFGYLDNRIEGNFRRVTETMEKNDKEIGSQVISLRLAFSEMEGREKGHQTVSALRIDQLAKDAKRHDLLLEELNKRLNKVEKP